jgi:uncharacterized repeat protein (TIGR01451 family)
VADEHKFVSITILLIVAIVGVVGIVLSMNAPEAAGFAAKGNQPPAWGKTPGDEEAPGEGERTSQESCDGLALESLPDMKASTADQDARCIRFTGDICREDDNFIINLRRQHDLCVAKCAPLGRAGECCEPTDTPCRDDSDCCPGLVCDDERCKPADGGQPFLQVTKTASSPIVTVSVPFTYTITVTNTGTGDAFDVVLVDDQDPELVLISANPPGAVTGNVRPDGFTITWSIGTLPAGEMRTFIVTKMPSLLAGDGDMLKDTATVTSSNAPPDSDEETVTVVNPPFTDMPRTPGFWSQQCEQTPAAKYTADEVQAFLNLISDSTTVSALKGLTLSTCLATLINPGATEREKLLKFLLDDWLNLAANKLDPTEVFVLPGFTGTDAEAKKGAEDALNNNEPDSVLEFWKDVLDAIANSGITPP